MSAWPPARGSRPGSRLGYISVGHCCHCCFFPALPCFNHFLALLSALFFLLPALFCLPLPPSHLLCWLTSIGRHPLAAGARSQLLTACGGMQTGALHFAIAEKCLLLLECSFLPCKTQIGHKQQMQSLSGNVLMIWLQMHAYHVCCVSINYKNLEPSRVQNNVQSYTNTKNRKLSRSTVFHRLHVTSHSRLARHIYNQKNAEPLIMLTEMQCVPAKKSQGV